MNISNTCVVLHNMIVRMQQGGCFYDEAGSIDLVAEILSYERTKSSQSRAACSHNVILSDISAQGHFDDIIDIMVMRELKLTDLEQHEVLMEELTTQVKNNKHLFNSL